MLAGLLQCPSPGMWLLWFQNKLGRYSCSNNIIFTFTWKYWTVVLWSQSLSSTCQMLAHALVHSLLKEKTRLGADCGSDRELLIAKSRLKLKKVGKTTTPFRHDLNEIPYDYTVEVTNRFKGLDLIECMKNYGWRFMTLYRRQWKRPSPTKRNTKRQNGCLRRPYK